MFTRYMLANLLLMTETASTNVLQPGIKTTLLLNLDGRKNSLLDIEIDESWETGNETEVERWFTTMFYSCA